ncbi:DNA primase [Rhodococcus opacus PD630]|uniref:DNA primase n=1 Tax=Rhodococcus TaxID=1827 RepID=UPI00029CBD68|nr:MULTISPECIES: DNA primase [Rhodococcus]KXF49690.1 DNA primase [Rhodococcus sp. SC4]RZK75088.1 MAG: DNA primase [Rhodococcus sp. (in: high G+C Gram-positive bacteria)]EHI42510.1 DNA primase [Rhodococcus opacus PD630]KXX61409.1 DNA primase [Rhodococcus sp. LB1]PBC50345.1 DNA primase [Rhodococcus sp. ACPA1]
MAGRIPDRDVAAIRERTRIEDIVGEYVSLKRAGGDSMKGLCPFHDEKSPSFHVRPNHGHYHCFGCGEGGDVYSFLQKIDHISFVEAVEQLADRLNYSISYEGGGTSVQRDRGTRSRLVAANAAAQEFYSARLQEPDAQAARDYLTERNFDAQAAQQFGCGYAPDGWDILTKHLLGKGFDVKELEAAGLSKAGRRGHIDRFHRRLLWPIRNLSGDVIGFGARKLFDDDTMPGKYVNTPETMLYKKSQVLFGLDLAKRDIAKGHQAVVVEGYTDVMAMHLAGVKTAVAACGTAFGEDHLAMLRRLLMDDSYFRGEIIYTFDGDAAGQAAAMKAFEGDQKMAGQTFVAVAPEGMDPCELRQKSGDAAVRDLVARRTPMFEFVVKSILTEHDLETAEGRVEALRRTVPVVAQIKEATLRDSYAVQLSGWVGWDDIAAVRQRVRDEARKRASTRGSLPAPLKKKASRDEDQDTPQLPVGLSRPRPNDPTLWAQREALKGALQYPAIAGTVFDSLPVETFTHPTYVVIRESMIASGGTSAGLGGGEWVDAVSRGVDDVTAASLVSELAVEPLPAEEDTVPRYISGVIARLQEVWVGEQVAELKSKLQRISPATASDEFHSLLGDLVALEQYRRSLLDQAIGDTNRDGMAG